MSTVGAADERAHIRPSGAADAATVCRALRQPTRPPRFAAHGLVDDRHGCRWRARRRREAAREPPAAELARSSPPQGRGSGLSAPDRGRAAVGLRGR
jgi:hypothetical protein